MSKVNIADAKTHLSRYIERVERGEVITICRRNRPVAELRMAPGAASQAPNIGWARARYGPWEIPDDALFEPLPDALLDLFEGGPR